MFTDRQREMQPYEQTNGGRIDRQTDRRTNGQWTNGQTEEQIAGKTHRWKIDKWIDIQKTYRQIVRWTDR